MENIYIKNSYDAPGWRNYMNNSKAIQACEQYYKAIFAGRNITKIHDCSMGSGGLTFPLYELGYDVSGSDINENMLNYARERANNENRNMNIFQADFRAIDQYLNPSYDCIISTGNSIPHVDKKGFKDLCQSIKNCLKSRGYFYFDIRNWDKITRSKQRFFPFKLESFGEGHKIYLQVWDYNPDGSMSFNMVFIDYDGEGNPIRKEIQKIPPYYPLLKEDIEKILAQTGFVILKYFDFNIFKNFGENEFGSDIEINSEDMFMKTDWYAVLAQTS